jgi:hypothetical protein
MALQADAGLIARNLKGLRSRSGYIARCPAHEDHEPSLSIAERDGKVLVHCHAGCSQADVIAALRARGLWPEREKRPWTPVQRADYAHGRAAFARNLEQARHWRRAAVLLTEELTSEFKAALSGAETALWPDTGEMQESWSFQKRLSRLEDAELVVEYRQWVKYNPKLTAGMVYAARNLEATEVRAVLRYLNLMEGHDAA